MAGSAVHIKGVFGYGRSARFTPADGAAIEPRAEPRGGTRASP
jgi:hypothetical protein